MNFGWSEEEPQTGESYDSATTQGPTTVAALLLATAAHSVLVMNPISYAAYTSHSKNALYLSISHFWLVPRT